MRSACDAGIERSSEAPEPRSCVHAPWVFLGTRALQRIPTGFDVKEWLLEISSEVRRILELPDVQDRMKNFDYPLAPSTPSEMDKILRADIETFAEVIRLAGLRPR